MIQILSTLFFGLLKLILSKFIQLCEKWALIWLYLKREGEMRYENLRISKYTLGKKSIRA